MIQSYNELTVGKYQELRKIELDDMDVLEQQVAIMAVLADMDEEEVFDMPLPEYQDMVAKMSFLNKPPQIDYKHKLKSITIDGELYDILQDAREMTAGQYIDYQAYLGRENFDEQLPYILTIFVLPHDHKYGVDYDLGELAEKFKAKMPITTAMEISSFFLRQSQLSIKISLRCLLMRLKMMRRKTKDEKTKEALTQAIMQLESLSSSTDSLDGLIPQ